MIIIHKKIKKRIKLNLSKKTRINKLIKIKEILVKL